MPVAGGSRVLVPAGPRGFGLPRASCSEGDGGATETLARCQRGLPLSATGSAPLKGRAALPNLNGGGAQGEPRRRSSLREREMPSALPPPKEPT